MLVLFSAIILSYFVEYLFTGKFQYRFHILNIIAFVVKYFEHIAYGIASNKYFSGILFSTLSILTVSAIFIILCVMLAKISIWLLCIFFVFVLSSFLSAGGLNYAALKIYHSLKKDNIQNARKNLNALAGRDSKKLDEAELSRAVIESVSENTGDGIGSVIFFTITGIAVGYLLIYVYNIMTGKKNISIDNICSFGYYCNHNGNILAILFISGLIGAVIYKTSNLMDSLVGYKNIKYIEFGRFSAKLDDLLNYIPFRITALFMLFSVMLLEFYDKIKKSVLNNGNNCNGKNNNNCINNNNINGNNNSRINNNINGFSNAINNPKIVNINKCISPHQNYDYKSAFNVWKKFKNMHPSPNAGQLESISAGALKILLGGTNYYGGIKSNRPILGFQKYRQPNAEDIVKSLKIMRLTSIIFLLFSCIFLFALFKIV
jgi:adenosylcobinamide-phosphate synthase